MPFAKMPKTPLSKDVVPNKLVVYVADVKKLFRLFITIVPNKLMCLSQEGFSSLV